MPTIRERLTNYLLKPQIEQIRAAADLLAEAHRLGPALMPPELMIKKLSEIDSQYIDLLLRQLQYSYAGAGYESNEQDRLRLVTSSRQMYDNDVLTEQVLTIWNNFGFGLSVQVTPKDTAAQSVWSEFWSSDQNAYILGQREIQDLSTQLLRDGDFLFVYFTNRLQGGFTVIRVIPTEQIAGGSSGDGIITMPDDSSVPVFYRRFVNVGGDMKVSYYADWRATPDMIAETLKAKAVDLGNGYGRLTGGFEDGQIMGDDGTQVKAMLVAHRKRGHRGYPLMSTGLPWSVAYRDFLQDRAAVARAISSFVNKLSVDGGQRAVDAMVSKVQSTLASGAGYEGNPRPTAGSMWIENKAATLERLPMGTGAVDANIDGASLLAQAVLAGSIYPHWVGRGEAYRLATATSMERPLLRAFNRYQLFWTSVWQDIAKYVLGAASDYGSLATTDYSVDVSTDAVIDVSVQDISDSASALTNLFDRGLVDMDTGSAIAEQLMRVILQTIGVDDIDAVLEPQGEPPAESEKVADDSRKMAEIEFLQAAKRELADMLNEKGSHA